MVRLKYIIWGAKVITSKIWGAMAPLAPLVPMPPHGSNEICCINNLLYFKHTHTLQCLIEMCAGNFTNQYVALDGQVLDSINRILGILCTEKFVSELSL